jgi:hypothetical protein
MRRLSQSDSSITVMMASCAFRHGVLREDKNKFFANCCEMVDPPATTRPFFSFFSIAF